MIIPAILSQKYENYRIIVELASTNAKATVEQLDTLILAFNDALPHISENPWPEIKAKQKISAKMKQFSEKGYIPSECLPKDLSRFCNNVYTLLQSVHFEEKVDTALNAIEIEISEASNIALFPRSISLLQYFFCSPCEKRDNNPP